MFKQLLSAMCLCAVLGSFAFGQERVTGVSKDLSADESKLVLMPVVTDLRASGKINPMLRYVVHRFSERNRSRQETISNLSPTVAIAENAAGEAMISVFIQSNNISRAMAAIKAQGGTVSTIVGDILTANIPVAAVEMLAAENEIQFMEVSMKSHPLMNVSHVEINADDVHAGTGLPQAYTGSGVVVGIVDSGIDWKHEDFDWSSGTTRIQYLWDMSGTGNPPAGYTYGTEYTKAQIDASQCNEIDGDGGGGHGTHVTGTAAGSGFAEPGYIGIAPESDIIFVKGIRDHNSVGGFSDTDVVDGCNYIFSQAQAMGKPAVINLSLGGHAGPHDGSSLYEQALNNLTGTGKIIVAAAGNEGANQIHVGYQTKVGSSYYESFETVWVFNGSNYISAVDMWYDTGDISVGIAAYDTTGTLLGFTNPVAPGQAIQNLPFTVGGITYGMITIDASATTYPKEVTFVIDSNNGNLPANSVFWSLYTFSTGSGTFFDGWVVTGGFFTVDSSAWFRPGNNKKSVGIPATANNVIAVGSYVSKNEWVDINGVTQQQHNPGGAVPTIGALSYFSSHGPTRDGRLKPEISAPGEAILSVMSSDLSPGVIPPENILFTGKHSKLEGTSMASPHVTGTVALMLQRNSTLNHADVLNILTSTARTDGFTGTVPNILFGHGKVDALAAVQNVPVGIAPLDITPARFTLEQNYPNPFNPGTTISFAIPKSEWVRLTVYDALGREVAVLVNREIPAGSYQYKWDVFELSSGTYFYRIEAGQFVETKQMTLLK